MSLAAASIISLNQATLAEAGQQLARTLVAGLWQGFVFALLGSLMVRLFPGAGAKARFNLWTGIFATVCLLPVLHWTAIVKQPGVRSLTPPPLRLDLRWSYALTAIWAAAVLLRGAFLLLQAFRLRSLWRSATPAPANVVAALAPLLGTVQLCISNELDRPGVIGFFAPRILIPAWLFAEITPGELHQIVLHEMEHLRRRDDWLNLIQKLALTIFPLNPALVWIDRRLGTERELACDDGVLRKTRAPRAYATCLTRLAERRLGHSVSRHLTTLALGAMELGAVETVQRSHARSVFSQRIEAILQSRPGGPKPAFQSAVAAIAIAGAIGVAAELNRVPELISFASPTQTRTRPQLQLASSVATAVSHETTATDVSSISDKHQPSNARFESVVFHPARPVPDRRKAGQAMSVKKSSAKPGAQVKVEFNDTGKSARRRPVRSWQVLTAWPQLPQTPMLVTLPDGRAFLAYYPAASSEVGWLVLQL